MTAMDAIHAFVERRESFFLLLIVTLTCTVLFWSLDKGLLFHDEAYYLLALKYPDLTIKTSYFPELVFSLVPRRLYPLRIVTVAALLLADALFAWGLFLYVRGKVAVPGLLPRILLLAVTGQFICYVPLQMVPHYASLNAVAIFSSTGLLLAAMAVRSRLLRAALAGLGGVPLGLLVFVNTPNAVIIPVLLLALAFGAAQPVLPLLASVLAGLLAGGAIGIFRAGGVGQIALSLAELSRYLPYYSRHGLQAMLDWNLRTLGFFLGVLPFALILFLLLSKGFRCGRALRLVLCALVAGYVVRDLYGNLFANGYAIFTPALHWLILCTLLIRLAGPESRRDWLLPVAVLTLLPYCASLGTNVAFEVRSSGYMSALLPLIYLLLKRDGGKVLYLMFFALLLLQAGAYLHYPFAGNWGRQVLAEQSVRLDDLNPEAAGILIDPLRYAGLERLGRVLPRGTRVLPSSSRLWGYLYVNDLRPVFLPFNFIEPVYDLYFDKMHYNIPPFVLLEERERPFPPGYIDRLNARRLFSGGQRQIKVADMVIYVPDNLVLPSGG